MKTLFAAAVTVSLLTGTVATAYADDDRDHGRQVEKRARERHDNRGPDRSVDRSQARRNDQPAPERRDARLAYQRNDQLNDNHRRDSNRRVDVQRNWNQRNWDQRYGDSRASNHRYDERRYEDGRYSDRRDWDRRDNDRYRGGYAPGYVVSYNDYRRYDRGRYIAPRGYYVRSWSHGEYLPRAYCDSRYIVSDYGVYHLSPPPRGYHWVRVNDDVVLAAVASGLVVSVVNNLFF